MTQLDKALRQFEATEANLVKLEKQWDLLQKNIPNGIVFAANPMYEDALRSYKHILTGLPSIDGWKPQTIPWDLDEIAQNRLDAREFGDTINQIDVERQIEQPGKELREYRYKFNQKRRNLIQNRIIQISNEIDHLLEKLQENYPIDYEDTIDFDNEEDVQRWQEIASKKIKDSALQKVKENIKEIDVLIGSSVNRPKGWSDMSRHLSFAEIHDLRDIILYDWPSVKAGINKSLYTLDEPIPVDIQDLGELVASNPSGNIITKLKWNNLSEADFERLIFNLVTSEQSYENAEWLMHTNAPDRGRDLSVYRVYRDPLSGVIRQRTIIQCKRWLNKSISLPDISPLKDQVKLWEPPRIDNLIIATTGRFTADAVTFVERHNLSDSAMKIELWAESRLESLLASKPALIAEFGLR
ncbi:restriction endonuclease [Anabaena azotica]|uniref:Restriction endonuclease n=1 Tax=Anabaena azotica FACHB-119 TaxID=947527 RepID=A0ABR8D045_9NOST|nr:restriction endonuclease [Anabaena azotica]MBD2500550.1 restriction endonuclease [Anabaena azotica FACHB-119]